LLFTLCSALLSAFAPQLVPSAVASSQSIIRLVTVTAMLCAISFLVFEFSQNVIGGTLLHFLLSAGLCYISGCIYPIHTFPVALQPIMKLLPTGLCRTFLSESGFGALAGIVIYLIAFITLSVIIRKFRIEGRRVS